MGLRASGKEGQTVDQKFGGILLRDLPLLSFSLLSSFLELGAHGVFEQLHGYLHGYYFAVGDVLLDQASEFAIRTVLLRAEEVAGREMLEAVVPH